MRNKDPKVTTDTRMYHEAQSASRVVARQLIENEGLVEEIGRLLRERQPQVVATCARGSSDHAATYGKYLIETLAGIPTASFAPSVSSVYAAKQNMGGAVFLALSQSGKSPDLLTSARAAKEAGALVIALVNVVDSPLAELAAFSALTAGLHAEAYSAAEVRHGPMAIVKRGFPVLLFTQDDGTRAGVDAVVGDFAARGYDPDNPPHLRKVTETV